MSPEEKVTREFVSTFNRSELNSFVGTLDPEVEIHSVRGLRRGRDEARAWATRKPGGVQQTVVIEAVEQQEDRVLLEIQRQWHWEEDGALAATEPMAWLFTLRDGLVASWRPFEDREEAREAFAAG